MRWWDATVPGLWFCTRSWDQVWSEGALKYQCMITQHLKAPTQVATVVTTAGATSYHRADWIWLTRNGKAWSNCCWNQQVLQKQQWPLPHPLNSPAQPPCSPRRRSHHGSRRASDANFHSPGPLLKRKGLQDFGFPPICRPWNNPGRRDRKRVWEEMGRWSLITNCSTLQLQPSCHWAMQRNWSESLLPSCIPYLELDALCFDINLTSEVSWRRRRWRDCHEKRDLKLCRLFYVFFQSGKPNRSVSKFSRPNQHQISGVFKNYVIIVNLIGICWRAVHLKDL